MNEIMTRLSDAHDGWARIPPWLRLREPLISRSSATSLGSLAAAASLGPFTRVVTLASRPAIWRAILRQLLLTALRPLLLTALGYLGCG